MTSPFDQDAGGGRGPSSGLVALGAAAGLAAMAVAVTGDVLAAGVLLGLAAADVVAGAVGVLAGLAMLGRWASTSFAALAGGQAVIGPGGWSGAPAMVASSWAVAVAVMLVCPPDRREPAVAAGLLAATLVAGPALGRGAVAVVAVRVVASAAGVAATLVVARSVPRPVARGAALVLAGLGAGLALLS